MAGTRYEDMPKPGEPHRPHRDTRHPEGKVQFEKIGAARSQDEVRAAGLKRSITRHPELFEPAAEDLLRRLEEGLRTRVPPPTLASYQHMRNVRIRVIGQLWKLVEESA